MGLFGLLVVSPVFVDNAQIIQRLGHHKVVFPVGGPGYLERPE